MIQTRPLPAAAPPAAGKKWLPLALAGAALMLVGFVTALFFVVTTAMKSSDAFTESLALARSSPDLAAAIGTPMEDGTFVMGSISVKGASGSAHISYPVNGPRGSARISVAAHKAAGAWTFERIDAEIDGRDAPIRIATAAPTL